jgi:4-hydroxy-2-oxoheptanedioate aldolase
LARYQPDGRRSFGGQRFGLRRPQQAARDIRPKVFAIIETQGTVRALEDVAAIPQLAGLVTGPGDLSLSLGIDPDNWDSDPTVAALLQRILDVGHGAGKEVWAWAGDGAAAQVWARRGFDRVSIGSDMALLRMSLARELARAKGQDPDVRTSAGGYGLAEPKTGVSPR